MKVTVAQTRTMEVSEEDFEYLKIITEEGDMQAFHEFTELDCEGKPSVEVEPEDTAKAVLMKFYEHCKDMDDCYSETSGGWRSGDLDDLLKEAKKVLGLK